MNNKKTSKAEKTGCPISPNSNCVVYVRAGQICTVCSFAKLEKEPGNIIRCPICGYGNVFPNT